MSFEFFDAIFQQPDICVDLDDPAVEAITYPATAVRAGDTWTAEAHDLPGGLSVSAEGSTWREVEGNLGTRVVKELGAGPGTVIVSLRPADRDATAAIHALAHARHNRAVAEQAERDAARNAARVLASQGWNVEDSGTALRLPTARVEKILTPAGI